VTLAVDEAIGAVGLMLGPKFESYQRNYIKLQSVLANIGGVFKAIMVIVHILNFEINKNLLVVEYINSFFKVPNKEQGSEETHCITKSSALKFTHLESQIIPFKTERNKNDKVKDENKGKNMTQISHINLQRP
jgi:hypothetical protein